MSGPDFYRWLRPGLFLLDPEHAHAIAMRGVRALEWAEESLGGIPLGGPPTSERLSTSVLGLDFPNPIGLAAGMDKNAEGPHAWGRFGFGYAELGTVTGTPQPGNPRPRMFRFPDHGAVVNRLGFNNAGADAVARNLAARLARAPTIPVGLNIGCSKVAMGDEQAEIADYRHGARELGPWADYLVVNVSSPNTPGLRGLQHPDRLGQLVETVRSAVREACPQPPPVLVKLSPDIPDDELGATVRAALDAGAGGLVATNTTITRPEVPALEQAPDGGLSGAPLRARANAVLQEIRHLAGPDTPIIGVGGIGSVEDVVERIRAGADLVGLYTAMIYQGPFIAARLAAGLDEWLRREGVDNVAALRAAAAGSRAAASR